MQLELPVSQDILSAVSRVDRVQGLWSSTQAIPGDRLPALRDAATVRSAGASCRLGGLRVSDTDVAGLLRDGVPAVAEAREVLGYAAALNAPLPGGTTRLLTAADLARLHALMLGDAVDRSSPSPWRTETLYREGFDAAGRATGLVFSTLPPRLVAGKTEQILTWLELELREGERHPALVIGAFALMLLSISPFERGNGRLSRLVVTHLLVRAGYAHVPYASLEAEFEREREEYLRTTHRSMTRLWTRSANIAAWLEFFMTALSRHAESIEKKVALERRVSDYPPLQRSILETVREHGNVDAALLLRATGANRNTLKDNLRRMVQLGVLEKSGQRRGTRYRMATGRARAATDGE